MKRQLIGKGLIFFAMIALGAFGLLAGQHSREIDIAFPEGPTKANEANEVRGGATSPRECDLQRGVDTGCTFL